MFFTNLYEDVGVVYDFALVCAVWMSPAYMLSLDDLLAASLPYT